MANPRTIRANLGTRLKTMSRLGGRVYERWPSLGNINTPCAVIDFGGAEPEQTFGRGELTRWDLQVYLLVSVAKGLDLAQDELDPLLATSSTGGIFGAIAADRTLGGAVDTCFVRGYRDHQPIEVGENLVLYSAVCDLEAWAT